MAETNAPTITPAAKARPRALGRGLESLLPATQPARTAAPQQQPAPAPPSQADAQGIEPGSTRWVPITLIDPNPFQTRTSTDEAALEELKASIAADGLLQPIVIRPTPNGRFHVVAGERRFLAIKALDHEKIQATIKQSSDADAMLFTVVENLVRKDLNPLEQAHAFARMSALFGLTQDEISKKAKINRSTVTHYLSILKLPQDLQQAVADGRLTLGHARSIAALHESPQAMAAVGFRVLSQGLSVRKTEEAVRQIVHGKPKKPEKPAPPVDPNVRDAQDQLQRALGLRVTVEDRNGKGKVIIEYANLDDFEVLMNSFGQKNNS
jgi:ParB family chromosome partitioning protein